MPLQSPSLETLPSRTGSWASWGAIRIGNHLHNAPSPRESGGTAPAGQERFEAGGILGALAAAGNLRRLGIGPALAAVITLEGLAILAMPAARLGAAAIVIGACQFVIAALEPTWSVAIGSIRQVVTLDHLRGRVTGTVRTIAFGIMPIGSVIGGILGTRFGIIPTLVVAGLLWGGSVLWILLGPVIRLRETPAPL